ncbi:MAG: FAD-binding oxidoreductase, partial [Caldilineaceae bacterium]|nr:FAD-binding oxidoreductase [Caldilineaceae bacterium]
MSTDLAQTLAQIVGAEHVSTAEAYRAQHAKDQSSHTAHLPDVVVWPASTTQVSQIARYANAEGIAITGWGAGSSLEGNSIPLRGGIVINFGRMNQILA